MMMTVGPAEGTARGTVGGETVYHGSLDPAEYERLLKASGFGQVELHLEDARVKLALFCLPRRKPRCPIAGATHQKDQKF